MKKTLLYILMIGFFVSLIFFIINKGQQFNPQKNVSEYSIVSETNKQADSVHETILGKLTRQISSNVKSPMSLLLLQIIVILAVSRFFAILFNMLGQQIVIGEITAGIILGPSLFGLLLPDAFSFVFPAESFKNLEYLSKIGLTFFMFVIGMELGIRKIKHKAFDVIIISHSSIIIPYCCGVFLAYFIFVHHAPANVNFLSFALFIGIAMSITAFPVLARIIYEKKLIHTKLGSLALTCGAVNDFTGWCILAALIAIVKAGNISGAVLPVVLAIVGVCLMLLVVRPFLGKISLMFPSSEKLEKPLIAIFFFILLLSAYIFEVIGTSALFGAFVAGIVVPTKLASKLRIASKIEDVSVLVFLPIFFAFVGLRTQIALLTEGYLWKLFGMVILFATLGKVIGSMLPAKVLGNTWKDSLSLGVLMNTRGLMELVAISIGYDLVIFSPEIFTILVLMVILTTFMTGPLLNLIKYLFPEKELKQSEVSLSTHSNR